MICFIGLIIYILFIYIFCLIFIKSEKLKRKIFLTCTCAVIILFQGLRSYSVGNDTNVYIAAYPEIGMSSFNSLTYQNFEVGYVILNRLLYLFGLDERMFLIIIAAIIQIPIFITIYKFSDNPLISILWYLSFGNFFMTFSGLRQSIAMSLCFWAYQYIKNHNLFKFILLIIFASLFHKSALFCLLLYSTYQFKMTNKKFLLSILIFIYFFIFKEQLFNIFCLLYKGRLSEITYTNSYTMLLIYLYVYVLSNLYIFSNDEEYIGLRNILFLLVLIYCFAPIFSTFTRIGFPLTLYMCIFVPKFIDLIKIKQKNLFNIFCNLILILCFFTMIGSLGTLPYSFF